RPTKFVPSEQGGAAAGFKGSSRPLGLWLDQGVESLEGRVRGVQRDPEENAADDRPKKHDGRDDADNIGHPLRHETMNSRRHEAERQLEEPRQGNQDCKSRQRDHADLKWMRACDWLKFHQFPDRILPLRRPPEEGNGDEEANAGGDKFNDSQYAALRSWQFQI